jgi:hypothetical protein
MLMLMLMLMLRLVWSSWAMQWMGLVWLQTDCQCRH